MTRLAARDGKLVRRRFVRANGRGVHFLRAGEGPPVILLHSALKSAREELPLLRRLASDHTVFAFDHPGMGDSDPLEGESVDAAVAADALNSALVALAIPGCPVYGSHTGGSVAVELARRHPERVAALVVNGVTVFDSREQRSYLSESYLRPFVVTEDGSHLFADWVRTRDIYIWFPWNQRSGSNRDRRLSSPMVSLEVLHDAFVERLRAGDGYRPVYASSLGHDGREAIGAVSVPATLMAHEKDPLYVHFERLDALKPDQHIGQYPPDIPAYELEKARVLRSYRVDAAAPSEAPFRPTPGVVNRRYVDFPGGQILVRSAGERRKSRPLVLLHDGRGSSRVFDPLMRALGTRRPVFAPDLPDNGASDPLASRRPTVAEYADAVSEVIAALGLESPDIYAVGAGAAVALELSGQRKFRGARLILEAPDFYAPKFRRWLAGSWTPPLAPEWDGGHLNRIWLMLRDEYAFWPWFDKSAAGACAVDAPTDWSEMHARVVDIVRSLATYHRLTAAALRYDWVEALRRSRRRVTLVVTAQEPRRRHVEEAAELCHLREVSLIPAEVSAKANALLRLLRDPPAKEA